MTNPRQPAVAALIMVLAAGLGCDTSQPSPLPQPSPAPTETPAFVLRGTVFDAEAHPIAGAMVALLSGRQVTTGPDGVYDLGQTLGTERVRAWKAGYLPGYALPQPDAGVAFLPITLVPGELLLPPTVRHSAFDPAVDRPCDPDWDSRAPCRRYVIAPDVDIDLHAEASWIGPGDLLDLMLFSGDTGVRELATPNGGGGNTVALTARVRAGQVLELRILAYYACDGFDLRVTATRPAS